MERNDHWLTLGARSTHALSPSASDGNAGPEIAALWASRLFGFYRASEANDPEIFMAGAAAILARYPEEIVRRVCSPSGLPASSKWLPSLTEIRCACDSALRPDLSMRARQDRIVAQLEARERGVSEAERERVARGRAALREELRGGTGAKTAAMDARSAPPELREQISARIMDQLAEKVASYGSLTPDPALRALLARQMAAE